MKRTRPKIVLSWAMIIGDNLAAFDHSAVLYVYRVDGIAVRGIHWSGRYDGPATQLADHLVRMARRHNVDYITTTESQQPAVMHVIQEAFADADLRWGTKRVGEYALMYDQAVFAAMPKFKPRLETMTRTPGRADWQQMKVGYFNLHHRKIGRRWRILVTHGPAEIESGSSFRRGRQAETAQTGWPKLGREMRRFRWRNWWVVQVLTADGNGDHFLRFWLDWFQDVLHAPSIWSTGLPKHGTHHGRLIDGAWIPGATKEAA